MNNNETDKFKIGISIKKQVGNSVVRNKLRRQIKSLFRQELFILSGVSIVLIVMNNNQVLNYSSIKNILEKEKLEYVGRLTELVWSIWDMCRCRFQKLLRVYFCV